MKTKYLNFLMRQGKIGGHKKGRVWVSTKEEIKRYIKEKER